MATYKAASETARGKGKSQGMNFVRQEKRMAIYLRDGLACCYCGKSVTDGVKLTLDHLVPHSKGGSNKESNLVTACHTCNSSRGNRDLNVFVEAVAGSINHGVTAAQIISHIEACISRPLNMTEAKEIIARQGSCFNALNNIKK